MSYPSSPGSIRITQSIPVAACDRCSFRGPGSRQCHAFRRSVLPLSPCDGKSWVLIQGPVELRDATY